MSYRRHGLRALGLCLLAALGVMAMAAASAQATTGIDWYEGTTALNGTPINQDLAVEVTLEGDSKLLSSFGAGHTAISILCTTLAVDNGVLKINGGSAAKLLFTNCSTFLGGSGTPSAACKPAEPIVAEVKDLLILHNGEIYDLFAPASGTTFTTLKLGEECAAGEEVPITGSLVVKDCKLDINTPLKSHLIEEATPQSLFGTDGLSFGVNPATLDGTANVSLVSGNFFHALELP